MQKQYRFNLRGRFLLVPCKLGYVHIKSADIVTGCNAKKAVGTNQREAREQEVKVGR